MIQLSAIGFYFLLALGVGILSYRKQTSHANFLIGNRSLNYWLTALAAHASDMGNWLFMGYPAIIFIGGLFNAWVAIGLTLCMFLNWQWIAPKLRILTEKNRNLTLSSFFESKLGDGSGLIRLFSAAICLLFYSIYIAAGLVGLGHLAESLFGMSYPLGIVFGIAVVITYVLIGGYVTLAWLDLFQGLFLLGVIITVPIFILPKIGGFTAVEATLLKMPSLLPSLKGPTFFQILSMSLGWGLGYFGQPHILTKFMGIREAEKIKQSKRVGMSWMVLSLVAATFVGLVAISFFTTGIGNPEMVFIEMVKQAFSFSPFIISFILCAIIAAIINVMSSQMLVISSILSEDFYRKFFPMHASEKKLLLISRLSIMGVALIALGIASMRPTSIFQLVLYAWSGLGAAFGPLLLYTLYGKKLSLMGAWVGMLSGGITSALWPMVNAHLPLAVEPLLPAFMISFGSNWGISQLISSKTSIQRKFETNPISEKTAQK
ncbi:MAG: sodium/proline symporter [Simkaniaceae bacterium]|nr:sodium/proline symporter [Simkaniaceae bacterium]